MKLDIFVASATAMLILVAVEFHCLGYDVPVHCCFSIYTKTMLFSEFDDKFTEVLMAITQI